MQFVHIVVEISKMNSSAQASASKIQCSLPVFFCLYVLTTTHQSSQKETSTRDLMEASKSSMSEADMTASALATLLNSRLSVKLLMAEGSSKMLGVGFTSILQYYMLFILGARRSLAKCLALRDENSDMTLLFNSTKYPSKMLITERNISKGC